MKPPCDTLQTRSVVTDSWILHSDKVTVGDNGDRGLTFPHTAVAVAAGLSVDQTGLDLVSAINKRLEGAEHGPGSGWEMSLFTYIFCVKHWSHTECSMPLNPQRCHLWLQNPQRVEFRYLQSNSEK